MSTEANRIPPESGWVDAEDLLTDPNRWDDPAFALWSWTGAERSWTPAVTIDQVARRDRGLAGFVAAVLEISDRSPILVALERAGVDGVYQLAGLSAIQARAHELNLRGCSYQDVADLLGCNRKTAETHIRRAILKLAVLAEAV